MDKKYSIKVICVEPEGSQEFGPDYEVEYYISDDSWITQDIGHIEFDNFEEGTNFEDYIDCYHEDIEQAVNRLGLTIDRFILCEVEVEVKFTEVAKIVV